MIPWMSVEEELPEKKGRYFCCMQRGNHEKKFLNYLHAVKTDPIKAGNMKKEVLKNIS